MVDLTWQNVDNDGHVHEPFATANIIYGDASEWISSWASLGHLVHGRIEALEHLASEGKANRFSRKMAYTIFASNLVDYAEKYRGMQSVVMHELEGFADVQLTTKESGVWTVPPYFIDSVVHLAGFIMNCSDAIDTKNNYCVTPGWNSMRFAKPLVPGAKYRSYVKMIPTVEDPTIYNGDVYIMQDSAIMGVVGSIQFRRYPRMLLSRFFSPPDKMATFDVKPKGQVAVPKTAAPVQDATKIVVKESSQILSNGTSGLGSDDKQGNPLPTNPPTAPPTPDTTAPSVIESAATSNITTANAITLIANEAGLELSDMSDDALFVNLGIDSLMSLVISEKLRSELDVKVSGSLFLDYETIGDLRQWLDEYYS